jgi:hypothetical protein
VAAKLELVPSEDAACVVLSNRANSRAFVDALCDRLLQTVLPGWPGIPAIPDPIPQPLAPIGDYAGQWRGDLIAQGRRVPVRLIIEAGQRASLAIDRGPEVPITELGLVDGVITGSSRGDIGSPDTRRNHVDTLALQLVLRGGAIDGEIIATNATATLPHWVELRRPASD